MRLFIALFLLCCCHVYSSEIIINTPADEIVISRPNGAELQDTASAAKAIFIEAFSTTYTNYYLQSGSPDPIEKWLRLRPGLTLQSWLSLVFDEEYKECLSGAKKFIYFCDSEGRTIGWLSHTPASEKGEVYLSQFSLQASHRNQKIATHFLDESVLKQLFPNAKEIKLIVRKINAIAQHLYIKAGFIRDETIDPAVYGDSYDDRYIGFRLTLK